MSTFSRGSARTTASRCCSRKPRTTTAPPTIRNCSPSRSSRIRNVGRHVKREVDAGHEVAVMDSAMADKTNELAGWTREASPKHDGRIRRRGRFEQVTQDRVNLHRSVRKRDLGGGRHFCASRPSRDFARNSVDGVGQIGLERHSINPSAAARGGRSSHCEEDRERQHARSVDLIATARYFSQRMTEFLRIWCSMSRVGLLSCGLVFSKGCTLRSRLLGACT